MPEPSVRKAFVLIDAQVHDPVAYAAYLRAAEPVLPTFGGRFLARGGPVETLEGEWRPTRLVVIEFPGREAAQRWFASPGYQQAAQLRRGAATFRAVLVDALPEGP